MEPGCLLITNSAQLILQRVDVVDLVLGQHVVSSGQLEAGLCYHGLTLRDLDQMLQYICLSLL